jgi:hypothetical protein
VAKGNGFAALHGTFWQLSRFARNEMLGEAARHRPIRMKRIS